jgi:uncharacterized protein YndB with AHSA1/START domain
MTRRSFEMFIPIDAPVESVWRALADARDLTNWFATNAAVDARQGGIYELSWEGDWRWAMEIERWEPPVRLRLVDRQARPFDAEGQPLTSDAPAEVVLEYTIEAVGSTAILRLVHSGFGHGANWDDELEGVSYGWQTELRVLKHYLERHAGRSRAFAWVRGVSPARAGHLWRALMSPGGLIARGTVDGLRQGDPVSVTLATGDRVDGHVLAVFPTHHLAITADNLGGAVLNIGVFQSGDRTMAQLSLARWDAPAGGDVAAFRARAQAALDGAIARLEDNAVAR